MNDKPEKTKSVKDKPERSKKKRVFLILLEVLALLVLLVLVGAGMLLWRVSKEPLNIGFAKPYVQQAVQDSRAGFDLEMDQVYLEWPDYKGPLLIGMGNVRLLGDGGTEIVHVESAGIGLSYPHLLLGAVRPTAIIINKPSLRIDRTPGHVGISLQDYDIAKDERQPTEAPTNWKQAVATKLTEIADNQFAKGTFFSDLNKMEIRNARVVIHDQVSGMSRYFTNMDAALSRTNAGASLSFNANLPGGSGFSAILDYTKNSGQFGMRTNISQVNPFLFGEIFHHARIFEDQHIKVTGTANILLDRTLNPLNANMNLRSDSGVLLFENDYDEPLEYKNAVAKLKYTGAEQTMQIEDLSVELNSVPMSVSSTTHIGPDNISVPITFNIPEMTAQQAASLIPKSEMDSDGGKWVGSKLRDGVYKDIGVTVEMGADRQSVVGEYGPVREWVWGMKNIDASFLFENMTIDYSDTLTPATKANGKGTFDGDNLTITGDSAYVKDVHGTNLDMVFSDFLVVGGGVANIKMDVDGPLSSYLEYLALDPINLSEDIGLDAKQAKGNLKAKLDVSFPTLEDLPKDEVKVSVNGTLSDLNLPDMVQGLPLTGGPLSLNVSGGKVLVKGKAQLANRDVTLDWIQNLDSAGKEFAMQVKAQIGADKELRNHFGIDLDDFIQGTLPVDLVFTEKPNGDAAIKVKGDLNPMKIGIKPFDYTKATGVPGTVNLTANLKSNVLKTITGLSLETQDLKVDNATLTFRQLKGTEVELARAQLGSAKIGKTLQTVDLEITPGNTWKVKAEGTVFDAGPFLKDEPKGNIPQDNPAFEISLKTDTMLTKKEQSIQKAKLYIELNKRTNVERLEVDAFAGKGSIYVRYKPNQSGQRNFHMEATDAGATLKAFDVFPDVIGGSMVIYGEPIGGNDSDDIYGTARMENFRVVNAPALARLINAMSITGLEGALKNEGLAFTKLEGTFEWLFRPQGSLLTIKNGRTSGASIGLSFEGKVDRASQTLDIKGTIVPMSEVNNIIGSIPLVGDILTGGSGLIAATYTMRGPAKEPQVSINPLSVLTPGFLRRILFEGGYEDDGPSIVPPEPKAQPKDNGMPTAEELLNRNVRND